MEGGERDRGPYTLVWNADWKEKVMRGHGPVEDANVYHRVVPTACYGVCVQYWEPLPEVNGKRKKVYVYVTVLTDVLDKTRDRRRNIEG